MRTLTVPVSGRLLVSQLAGYGLCLALDSAGERAFVRHDPDSLDLTPQILTTASDQRVTDCVRRTAAECENAIEADLIPGQTGNNRRPVIWARATKLDHADRALRAREELLDELEADRARIAAALLAGLGTPATWLGEKPQRGASQLDGVPGNSTSDFVRGVLRPAVHAARGITDDDLAPLWTATRTPAGIDQDKTGWSPPGTHIDLVYQWLAAIGLAQLPVGLVAHGPSRTPTHWRDAGSRGVTLPVLAAPTSIPRLRALLQRPELTGAIAHPAAAARIRALGIRELVSFPVLNRSNATMVAFSFAKATRIEL
jgi:hypothetical protein